MTRRTFHLDGYTRRAISNHAARKGITVSAALRDVITAALDRRNGIDGYKVGRLAADGPLTVRLPEAAAARLEAAAVNAGMGQSAAVRQIVARWHVDGAKSTA